MKRVNGRQKGASFEREVAPSFAKWSGSEVKRTPLSGGWQKESSFNVKGDLVSTDTYFPCSVECKKQESYEMEQFLPNKKCPIYKWWKQCVSEAPYFRLPVLVFTRNRRAVFAMVSVKKWKFYGGRKFRRFMTLQTKKAGLVYIILLKDFLKRLPYQKARKVARSLKRRS